MKQESRETILYAIGVLESISEHEESEGYKNFIKETILKLRNVLDTES